MPRVRTRRSTVWNVLPSNVEVLDCTDSLYREFDTPCTIHLLLALLGSNDQTDLIKHCPNFKNFHLHPQYNELSIVQTHATVMLEECYTQEYIPHSQMPFAKRLVEVIEEYAMHPHRRYVIVLNALGFRLWEAEKRRADNEMRRTHRRK